MPDGGFQIFKAKENLGKISPEVEGIEYVRWLTADLSSDELAQKIGQAIQDKEM